MPTDRARLAAFALLTLAACRRPEDPTGTDEPTAPTPTTPTLTTPTTPTMPTTPTPPPPPVWVAISGGGYHSHTAQAAWTMGMLDASGGDLEALFANVRGFSSNSGGSWFLTQLAWSTAFREAIETDRDAWDTDGYVGQTAALFDLDTPCGAWSGPALLMCANIEELQPVFAIMSLPGVLTMRWTRFVERIVYAPFGMNDDLRAVRLDGERQTWAADKSILVATALVTDRVVLDEEDGFPYDKELYTATPATPGGLDYVTFTPAIFSSIADPALVAPDVLTAGDADLAYTTNGLVGRPHAEGQLPAAPAVAVSVIEAASASSAAPAAGASVRAVNLSGFDDYVPLSDEEMANIAQDLAPSVRLGPDGLETFDTSWGLAAHAAGSSVRLGDGGYVDNTAVAPLLRHLADNGALDDFRIVSFMNTTNDVGTFGGLVVPDDVAWLFGEGSTPPVDGLVGMCVDAYCIPTRVPHVFDAAGLAAAEERWRWSDRGITLVHFRVEVTTVENASFGVPGGHHGTVDFFLSRAGGSDILPLDAGIVASYTDVLEVTREAVARRGGWKELADALGIPGAR